MSQPHGQVLSTEQEMSMSALFRDRETQLMPKTKTLTSNTKESPTMPHGQWILWGVDRWRTTNKVCTSYMHGMHHTNIHKDTKKQASKQTKTPSDEHEPFNILVSLLNTSILSGPG